MTNRNVLLGRSKPSEKLTREEIDALEQGDRAYHAAGEACLGRRAVVRSGWSAGTC